MPKDDVQFTEEEIKKVNEIIAKIQLDLKKAIEAINSNDFDKALEYINSGMERTECPLCQKKLKLLKADVVYTKTVCPLDIDLCKSEKKTVYNTAIELKDDFVPMANTKKAIKDKKKEIETESLIKRKYTPFPDLLSFHLMFPGIFKKK